jgi:hypothetical protein
MLQTHLMLDCHLWTRKTSENCEEKMATSNGLFTSAVFFVEGFLGGFKKKKK